MASIALPKEPYSLDPLFEKAVVTLCACRPRFWSVVGYLLDPDCVGIPASKLVLQACVQIAKDIGHGPGSLLVTLQRVRQMMSDGKITLVQLQEVATLFDEAEDFGLPTEEDVIGVLAPILKRRAQSAAIVAAHDEFARKGDFKRIVDHLQRAELIGVQDMSVGTVVGPEGFAEIDQMGSMVRLPTGILELDLQLNDGLHRGGLGVVLGGSGDGKSQFLIHQSAEAMRMKLFVGFATLELPKPVQLARLFANLTGVPINQILENASDRKEAQRRMEVMAPHIGACIIEEFPPHATTVKDIRDWIDRCADRYGRRFDLFSCDYGDKLHAPNVKNDNEYLAMRYVYEGLRRDIAVEFDMWVWTGAQATRANKDQGKRLELHHVSDSTHKVRVADLVMTLNARDEGQQMLYFIAKNRLGKNRFQVGPIPTDFARARMVPAASEYFDWSKI